MSRKSFLILGLVIIQLSVTATAVIMFLALSKIIDIKAMDATPMLQIILPVIAFGIILHLRFKEIGRRKRILALCLPIYIMFLVFGGNLALGYATSDVFGAEDRFFGAIKDWAALDDPKPATPWNTKQVLDYVFFFVPMFYLQNLGLFALLWFGSLDPQKPSSNWIVVFVIRLLSRKANSLKALNEAAI